MRDDIVVLLDKADLAVGTSAGVVAQEELASAAESIGSARVRLSYPADVLVAALAGGTGSGKSSLANALCETDAAAIGGIRPTTDEPLALVPSGSSAAISGYLDAMGVTRRRTHDAADWLCLIDMPDTDSVELDHRLRFDMLLPRLDVVIWVLDPEKYRDASLHHGYLKRLAPYAAQFVFVLNQADRLGPGEVDGVVADLEAALTEDGIGAGTIIVTAANPPLGPASGIAPLRAHLSRIAASRSGCYDKLLIDLAEAGDDLLSATGGNALEFEARAAEAKAKAATLVSEGNPEEAVDLLKELLTQLSQEAAGPPGSTLADMVPSIPGRVHAIFESLGPAQPGPKKRLIRWSEPRPIPLPEDRAEAAAGAIDETILQPARDVLAARAAANAALAEFAISVGQVRARAAR